MTESAEQMPALTQTARGGKRIATRPRKMSKEHIVRSACLLVLLTGLKIYNDLGSMGGFNCPEQWVLECGRIVVG